MPFEQSINEIIAITSSTYPIEIENAIRQRTAVAAVDTSMDEQYLATHWIVRTSDNNIEVNGSIESKSFSDGMIHTSEAIGTLDLIKNINENTKHMSSGEVTLCINSKKVLSEYRK